MIDIWDWPVIGWDGGTQMCNIFSSVYIRGRLQHVKICWVQLKVHTKCIPKEQVSEVTVPLISILISIWCLSIKEGDESRRLSLMRANIVCMALS